MLAAEPLLLPCQTGNTLKKLGGPAPQVFLSFDISVSFIVYSKRKMGLLFVNTL